jgi:long-chain acyl-CoA synthetase
MVRDGGDFKSILYSELYEGVRAQAGGLRALGLERGDRLALQSENCVEWALTDWACQCLGIVLVPIYSTLPADQTQFIVADCGANVALAGGKEHFDRLSGAPSVRVVMLKNAEDSLESLAKNPTNAISKGEFEAEIDRAGPEDLATLIYTSGTTGNPKGVMLPHRAFMSLSESAQANLPLDEKDRFLCFLPMSHVYERFAGQVFPISFGGCIAYAKNLASLAHDMVSAKPTVMLCVPRFLEATMDRIIEAGQKERGLKRKMFDLALDQGRKKARGQAAPFYALTNALVGKRIREKVGGRLRFFVSGGAAMPAHVFEFYASFGLKVLQGYGLTETCAASCINHPDRINYLTVGEPIPGVEIKIAEDGEVLIKGPCLMLGYYNLPEDTAAAIDEQGWFHTGDIGEFEGKCLKITDRKKDLLVLANGKNVAPQPIESKLRASPFIQEAVVLGDSLEYCIALVVPNFEQLKAALEGQLKEGDDLMANAAVRSLIRAEIDKVNKTLAPFEMVKKHAILNHMFTIESGELTPTLKVKRKVVKERYAKELAELSK